MAGHFVVFVFPGLFCAFILLGIRLCRSFLFRAETVAAVHVLRSLLRRRLRGAAALAQFD